MKKYKLLAAITIVNIALVAFQLIRTDTAGAKEDLPILRGRALQIVDDQGRVRASISILKPDSKSDHETVILRMIDTNGRPNVKLTGSSGSSGIALGGATDDTYAIIDANGDDSFVKLTNRAGRKRFITP